MTAASVGTRKGQGVFTSAVNDVVRQRIQRATPRTFFCPASTDPCLQIADYCTWAIQRKWEKGDTRSYDLIRDRIVHEHDTFAAGQAHYY